MIAVDQIGRVVAEDVVVEGGRAAGLRGRVVVGDFDDRVGLVVGEHIVVNRILTWSFGADLQPHSMCKADELCKLTFATHMYGFKFTL